MDAGKIKNFSEKEETFGQSTGIFFPRYQSPAFLKITECKLSESLKTF